MFKPAVGEAVVELVRPIREKTEQLLADKTYLESIYKEGAERASYLANKTLRKKFSDRNRLSARRKDAVLTTEGRGQHCVFLTPEKGGNRET